MAPIPFVPVQHNEDRSRKIQKLSVPPGASANQPDIPRATIPNKPLITSNFIPDSSFSFISSRPSLTSLDELISDITRYIPIGCLRIHQPISGVPIESWVACRSWRKFAHPQDLDEASAGLSLPSDLQEQLLKSSAMQGYRGLHKAGWIRMEFKNNNLKWGQVRIYILPDDVGRAVVNRNQKALKRALSQLLWHIDVSSDVWDGRWPESCNFQRVDPSLDMRTKEEPTLFQLFNTLPSPDPNPDVVSDVYVQDAMRDILASEIDSLNTTMYHYQRRSAALMLQREEQPSQTIDPRLTNCVDQGGQKWYLQLDAGVCLRYPRTYEASRGGILAETMGLGKTLICLSLILATRFMSSTIPMEYSVGATSMKGKTRSLLDMAATVVGRSPGPWRRDLSRIEAEEGYSFEKCRKALKQNSGFYYLPAPPPRRESRHFIETPPRKVILTCATIVVVPPNLIQQWQAEIAKHTTGMKVLCMNKTAQKLPPAEELAEYDIILFSKLRFDIEAREILEVNNRIAARANLGARVEEYLYHSPLKDLHFKRLIVDEGHNFGNASKSSRTEALAVVDFLQVTARWIVSGTPTQGLYGADIAVGQSGSKTKYRFSSDDTEDSTPTDTDDNVSLAASHAPSETSSHNERMFYKQERKDLEKLGNIATMYLKARPWSISQGEDDHALWSHLMMQPRHGSKSHGNTHCLKSTMEGMIIRHRADDVLADIALPPLHQKVVYLDGSLQNKLSLNTFNLMVIVNAVTSERKDADYFFHPRQRVHLLQLLSNLRQASFFWSGNQPEMIQSAVQTAKNFLEKKTFPIPTEDEKLLQTAIAIGESVVANGIYKAISQWHEMPVYVHNELPEETRRAWALDNEPKNPTLMGANMVHMSQTYVASQLWKEDPTEGLREAGSAAKQAAALAQEPEPEKRTKSRKDARAAKKTADSTPALAGGVAIGSEMSAKRASHAASSTVILTGKDGESSWSSLGAKKVAIEGLRNENQQKKTNDNTTPMVKSKSALKTGKPDISGTLDPSSPLAATAIVSTASAKLSYLMDCVMEHQKKEKIIIFYEADNVAWYIAQALECLGVKHLIYAKSLSSARRSQYVVTFNHSPRFRVLLMDVSQAAYGLDMSSASRVYFVNPVFSPQVEAQAVKRAHRIGQTKPVYVETLVLRGSIEEVMIERRKDMSNEEHNKCKNLLDDQMMYNWVRNVRFLPMPDLDAPGPEQMAKLKNPQLVFGRGVDGKIHDPDADLVTEGISPSAKSKGKRKAVFVEAGEQPSNSSRKKLRFGPDIEEQSEEENPPQSVNTSHIVCFDREIPDTEESSSREKEKKKVMWGD